MRSHAVLIIAATALAAALASLSGCISTAGDGSYVQPLADSRDPQNDTDRTQNGPRVSGFSAGHSPR